MRARRRSDSAEEQQAEEEQQVVGADGDVVRAGRHERRQHRAHALPRPGVVGERRVPCIEDRLMAQRVALVDVDERLVRAVVREHRGVELDPARSRR